MRQLTWFSLALFSTGALAGGPVCVPDVSTKFTDTSNKSFSLGHNALGPNQLYEQCSNLSDQVLISALNGCGPLTHPLDGLGLSPQDEWLYGLMPTDALGIGTHLELPIPFPAPGQPGDMMKADLVDVYRIGNDGGYQRIGHVEPAPEDGGLPAGTHQVIPLVHSAATFNPAGDLFVLGYKTNYTSSANVMAGTGEVLYQTPQIVIGQVAESDLSAAAGGAITTTWSTVNTSSDAVCDNVMTAFRDRTNDFSVCVVADFIANGNADNAVQNCLTSTQVLDFGIHDFAVSPSNGHFYAYDSMTYDDRDVLIDVDPNTMVASCSEVADLGNNTGVLTGLMFSEQNKLVAIFANQNTGQWIDVSNGSRTPLSDVIVPHPFGDGASMVPAIFRPAGSILGGLADAIFRNGFEGGLIFANGFEGDPPPPTCPAF